MFSHFIFRYIHSLKIPSMYICGTKNRNASQVTRPTLARFIPCYTFVSHFCGRYARKNGCKSIFSSPTNEKKCEAKMHEKRINMNV